MFLRLRRNRDGNSVIDAAIQKFDAISADIERGIDANNQKIGTTSQTIATLIADNDARVAANDRGRRVVSKLRDLIA